jgi:hypothetical protein
VDLAGDDLAAAVCLVEGGVDPWRWLDAEDA